MLYFTIRIEVFLPLWDFPKSTVNTCKNTLTYVRSVPPLHEARYGTSQDGAGSSPRGAAHAPLPRVRASRALGRTRGGDGATGDRGELKPRGGEGVEMGGRVG